jgi:hypothetical protein
MLDVSSEKLDGGSNLSQTIWPRMKTVFPDRPVITA